VWQPCELLYTCYLLTYPKRHRGRFSRLSRDHPIIRCSEKLVLRSIYDHRPDFQNFPKYNLSKIFLEFSENRDARLLLATYLCLSFHRVKIESGQRTIAPTSIRPIIPATRPSDDSRIQRRGSATHLFYTSHVETYFLGENSLSSRTFHKHAHDHSLKRHATGITEMD